jgi:hypothetical protein
MEIKIAKLIDEYTLVINKGSDDGVKDGQRFLVYAFGEDIADPDTGLLLGKLEIVKGTGRATHVQSKIATISSDMKSSARRTIRKKPNPIFRNLIADFAFQEVEEVLPGDSMPFESVAVGDLAKSIN